MGVVLLVVTAASLTLVVVGLMGLFGRLPRNHFAGMRTREIMASDETWNAAHRAGGPALIFAGVASAAIGLAFLPFVITGDVSRGLALAIIIAQLALVLGGVLIGWLAGTRAARGMHA